MDLLREILTESNTLNDLALDAHSSIMHTTEYDNIIDDIIQAKQKAGLYPMDGTTFKKRLFTLVGLWDKEQQLKQRQSLYISNKIYANIMHEIDNGL